MSIDLPGGLGYEDTVVGGAEQDAYLRMVGRAGYVTTLAAGRVSIVPGEARTVEIGAGTVFGNAIRDEIPAGTRLQLPEEPAGSRYHLIVRRATWGTTNASTIDAIRGTDVRSIPPRESSPGTEADLPLALVRITANTALPTDVVDLRLIATEPGVYTILDDLALQLAADRPGIQCYNAKTTTMWTRTYDAAGSLVWVATYPTRQSGIRPHMMIGRENPFASAIISPDAPVYAAVAEVTRRQGDADAHMRAHLGDSQLRTPHSATDPARIEILTGGVYAVEIRAQVIPAADMQFYIELNAPNGGGYPPVSRAYAPAGRSTEVTLTAQRYYAAGRTISGKWGANPGTVGFTPQRFFITATRMD